MARAGAVLAAAVPPVGVAEPVVPAAGAAGPVATVPAVAAPVPADAMSVPVLECLADLPRLRRLAPRAEVRLNGISFTLGWLFGPVVDEPVPLAGGSVVGSDPLVLETALTGAVGVIVGMIVGVTAGVAGIDAGPTEKDPEAAGEVLEGSEAGTTVPVSLEVQPRPWHTLLLDPEVEVPVVPGRPLTKGMVAAGSEAVVEVVEVVDVVVVDVEEVVVPVVVVPVVVVPVVVGSVVVVFVGIVLTVPVAPAATSVVVPVEGVAVEVVVVVWAGVADCGVVSVLWVLADVVGGVDGCDAGAAGAGRVWVATGVAVRVAAAGAGATAT